jgi:hypothetical protein
MNWTGNGWTRHYSAFDWRGAAYLVFRLRFEHGTVGIANRVRSHVVVTYV